MDRQLCTFVVDGRHFGVPVQRVQEVIRYQEMTKVPLAPKVVGGLINLRGQIVTALDLRCRLNLPPRDSDRLPMNVVVRCDDAAISFLVDEIGDVIEVDVDAFERSPETIDPNVRHLIEGAFKLDRNLLLLLDIEKAASLEAA